VLCEVHERERERERECETNRHGCIISTAIFIKYLRISFRFFNGFLVVNWY
jgi:hypothetical protein